jgi:drug/metabolite transporter (DMT)-like permease
MRPARRERPGRLWERPRKQADNLPRPGRLLTALLANVTVVTALLVYFGWARAEAHAAALGIDESLLGMTVQDYVLRSVGPVLVMLVAACVLGLAWVAVEPRLERLLRPGPDRRARAGSVALLLLSLSWLILPITVRLLGEVVPVWSTILFPASIGVGVLLWSYSHRIRAPGKPSHRVLTDVCVGVLVLVCVFWTASNYATDQGRRLAAAFPGTLQRMPSVTVYSSQPLHLDGPGVHEQRLGTEQAGLTYKYTGLRFVEHTGGNYFLVSDGWSPEYGVFFVLPDNSESTRFEFTNRRQR